MERDRLTSGYKSSSAPTYGMFSREFAVSMTTALLLVVGTIALMVALATTWVADLTIWLYTGAPLAPFVGLAVFGIALTAGRYLGLREAANGNEEIAMIVAMGVAVVYGAFGAGILSLYESAIWMDALLVTFAVVALYTVIVTTVVYTTDRSFERWATYSGLLMFVGVIAVLVYTFVSWQPLAWIAFGAILLGFAVDLVYEIWHTSFGGRSALANGIAVYVAFMGIFVHVLQIVLELMAEQ